MGAAAAGGVTGGAAAGGGGGVTPPPGEVRLAPGDPGVIGVGPAGSGTFGMGAGGIGAVSPGIRLRSVWAETPLAARAKMEHAAARRAARTPKLPTPLAIAYFF